ncbi:MAG: GNAT family protein [Candidatus Paceibacterota bacterium]
MLKGKKVLLRPVKRSDIDHFLKWFNDQEVIRYLSMYLPMTEIGEENWIEEISTSKDSVFFVIEAIGNNRQRKTIGCCGLHNLNAKDQCAEFGIAIGERTYWDCGFGTQAARLLLDYGFMELNLHRVSSGVCDYNERSIAMHERAGFVYEGISREAIYKNGRFWDRINFGMLKVDWEIIRKKENSKKPA